MKQKHTHKPNIQAKQTPKVQEKQPPKVQAKQIKTEAPKKDVLQSVKKWFAAITTNKSIGQLIFRSAMMIIVPYIYLILCGMLDSQLLRNGFSYREPYIRFVFFSFIISWIIAFILIGISVYKFCKTKK